MIKAAGILIVSKTGKILYLKRGPGSDYPGMWAFPGGRVEDGEDTMDAAIRETEEEAGYKANARNLMLWTRRIMPAATPDQHEVDFTTYILQDVDEFMPVLGPPDAPEHTAYQWSDYGTGPPEPIHPGCLIALMKMSPDWDESKVAQAMAAGLLTSPQKYANITFFNMRITGTEQSYRSEKRVNGKVVQEAEHVWRDPSLYMTPEFLARCNGLPVILEHPPDASLTTEEYRNRNIGSIMLPYLKEAEKEVWGVARVMDEPAAEMMEREQLSTSPAVVWDDPEANHSGKFDDGKNFFIEGKPSLLDHLAVCWQGVWDKGRGPTGIATTRGDSVMTDDELKKALEAMLAQGQKTDTAIAALAEGFKGTTARLDNIQKRFDEEDDKEKKERKDRLDAFHFSKRKDGEDDKEFAKRRDAESAKYCADMEGEGESKEMAADKAKKRRDEDEKEEKKAADAAAADAAAADAKKDEDGDGEDNAGEGKKSKKDAKADADEDDDEKKSKKDRKDSMDRSDSVSRADYEALKAKVEELTTVTKPITDEELNQFGKVRSRADSIFSALGQDSIRPHAGESLLLYRRRVAGELKKNTKYAKSELAHVAADAVTFDIIEQDIYKEAEEFSKSPARLKPGELRMRTIRLDSGHTVNEFDGDSDSWMRRFAGPVKQAVKIFNINNKRN